MIKNDVRVWLAKEKLARDEQLAWKMACIAADHAPIGDDVIDMVINRIIDNAAVAIAAINRKPVANARVQALCHPRENGAMIFGMPNHLGFCAEWVAWANGTAVRELDFHDTFLAADYSHPGDNIPPILAVAQQLGKNGQDLLRGIVTGYEMQIDLVKSICLHQHKKDHIAHLCPAQAAGIGALLDLPVAIIYQAIQQAVHVSFTTRQSRKGEISSWKAYAPAHAGKLAVEAVDRAMRGEGSPSPIYEGEDSVIAYMLDGKNGRYVVSLPAPGEPKRAILESYTKAHSAEYQAQALIDLACEMRQQIADLEQIKEIVIRTSHHTHTVIGTGAGDPQKMDPAASRETLDHSIMYIFAVALQDGVWHHVRSYAPERARRPDTVRLWHKIRTLEDAKWTAAYHDPDPSKKAFGACVEIILHDGSKITREKGVANAHPAGAKPFTRSDYIRKFDELTESLVQAGERNRFLTLVQDLPSLQGKHMCELNVQLATERLTKNRRDSEGIF